MDVNNITRPEHLRSLIAAMRDAGVSDLKISSAAQSVRLQLSPLRASGAPSAVQDHPVAAPVFGTLCLTAPDQAFVLPQAGDRVDAAAIIAFVRTGPAFFAIRSPAAGLLSAPLTQDGATIGFGQHIFDIRGT